MALPPPLRPNLFDKLLLGGILAYSTMYAASSDDGPRVYFGAGAVAAGIGMAVRQPPLVFGGLACIACGTAALLIREAEERNRKRE